MMTAGVPIPKKIKIGSQTYAVYERNINDDPGLNDAHAYTYTNGNFIVVNKDLNYQLQRRYLMHEILHAVIFVFGQTDKADKDERTDTYENLEHWFIYLLQEPLVMLLRDNPSLVNWLTAKDQ
jgi:Zn-dependent peptidase ImmA (M78 family)